MYRNISNMEIIGDFNTSVKKALSEIDSNWESYKGLIVCGTHNPHNTEAMIKKIREARENDVPFLGICFGFELMLIEWVRHLGWSDATSAELDANGTTKVIVRLPEIRVGVRPVYWRGKETQESHWHHYGFARKFTDKFEKDWELSWTDGILEIAQLRKNTHHKGLQYHPEYNSFLGNPHPMLKEFLIMAKKYG